MTCHRRTLLACAALGALSATLPAAAQDSWPTKTVRLIVPYAAGGFADTRARKIADALGKTLGQPVIVDNRAGAGGVTGTDAIAKATDGHTFGFGSPAPLVTSTPPAPASISASPPSTGSLIPVMNASSASSSET